MAHSIDLKSDNSWDEGLEFLSNVIDTEYLYEIWYKGY